MMLNSKDLQAYTSYLFEEWVEKSQVLTAKTVSEADDTAFINIKYSESIDAKNYYLNDGSVERSAIDSLFARHKKQIEALYNPEKHYGILFGIPVESIVFSLVKSANHSKDEHFPAYIAASDSNPPSLVLWVVSRVKYLEKHQ
jgi:hypothetical protein